MSPLREAFLKMHWMPYPAVPALSVIYGRMQSLTQNSDGQWDIQYLFDGKSLSLLLSVEPAVLSYRASQILMAGDLFAMGPDYNITLLAPMQKEFQWAQSWNKDHWQLWSYFLQSVREFFYSKNFIEVSTPTLVDNPGSEPSLDPLQTQLYLQNSIGVQCKYLPTSPELHLKKVLAMGATQIFEIAKVFRNRENTSTHQPEFWMLEWYRAFSTYDAIKTDVQDLFLYMLDKKLIQNKINFVYVSVADLFPQAASIDDVFCILFAEKIEPRLDPQQVTFVDLYPPFQAALARLNQNGWARRFEVYWQGFELANAFDELNDPAIQRQRFVEDMQKKQQLGKDILPADEDFFNALDRGLPPSGGIALGLERLFMAIQGIKDIRQTKIFPF
jgi:lysyl-tRNA synthetase class 2